MPVFNNILAGSSGQGDTGYDIDQSLRLDDGDSAFLSKAYASSGNRKTWTFSCWVKRAETSSGAQPILSSDFGPTWAVLEFLAGDNLTFNDYTPSGASYQSRRETTALYRDVGAWYHIVVRYDTTDSTAGDRLKLYVNGEQVTDFANSTDPSLNYDGNINYGNGSRLHGIGKQTGSGDFYDGYLAEVNFIDGQALTPASFGETNSATNQWVPIEVTGMTYGTNGFYQKYSATELATSFTDSSSSSHTLTANGDVANSRAQKKIGSSSIYFDGSSDFISTPDSSDWEFGSGDFTLETWVYHDDATNVRHDAIMGQDPLGDGAEWWFKIYQNKLSFAYGATYPPTTIDTSSTVITANTWQHVAAVRDGSTFRMYVDGTQVHSSSAFSIPNISDIFTIGAVRHNNNGYGFKGFMDEIRVSNTCRYPDGTTFTPSTTAFASDTNTKLLIHSDFDGGLGADSSGNKNDFSATNLVATDQVLDSPTRNYCTLNPLETRGTITLSEGNLKGITGAGDSETRGTIAIPQSGKWYWEFCMLNSTSFMIGVIDYQHGGSGDFYTSNKAVLYSSGAGTKYNFSSVASYGATWTTGDIMGVAFNRDDNQITFYKNNSAQPTLTIGGTADERARLIPIIGTGTGGTAGGQLNFGADSSFAGTKTAQGNGDDGEDFYYTPPTGYKALNTSNLDDPAIALPGNHFNTKLYTGTGSELAVTGVGFQPDFTWIKTRQLAYNHRVFDSVRGVTKELYTNTTGAEVTDDPQTLKSFDSDGFTLGTSSGVNPSSSSNMVSWNWKAGGTASSNGNGSITSSVSANTTAGFSIVSYTGTGANATVGHGLSQIPDMVIVKSRSAAGRGWVIWAESFSGSQAIEFDTSGVVTSTTSWNSSLPTSTVINLGTRVGTNESSTTYIAYCFNSIEGYSKVGTYSSNNLVDGPFIYLGFTPAYILLKCTSATDNWNIYDIKRNGYNGTGGTYQIRADSAAAGFTAAGTMVDLVSNGMKIRTNDPGTNGSGRDYLFYAVASNPFKTSNAR